MPYRVLRLWTFPRLEGTASDCRHFDNWKKAPCLVTWWDVIIMGLGL